MPHYYSAGGHAAATAANTGDGIAILWNPSSSTIPIYFVSYTYIPSAGGQNCRHKWQRYSTRGTPGSTVTPDIDNDWEQYAAPASGALLDLAAYSVQPTLVTPVASRWVAEFGVAINNLTWIPPKPIKINPGEGFGANVPTPNICGEGDVTIEWFE